MTETLSQNIITSIESHLRDRGIDTSKTHVIIDTENNMATFLLYNLSGQLVGYQRYNPNGDKKERGDTLAAKYFTWVTKEDPKTPKIAVWGTDSIDINNPNLFVTEGIFDANKIRNAGHPAIAVLANNPKPLKAWFKALGKKTIAITDRDDAGRKLGNLTDETIETPAPYKDLGEMPQHEVNNLLKSHGFTPSTDIQVKKQPSIEVRPVESKQELETSKDYIINQHYIRRWPKAVQAVLGIFQDGKQIGTMLYGIGTRAQSSREIFQNEDGTPMMQNNQMWELQRVFTTDESKSEIPNLGSMVISHGNEWIRKNAQTKDGKPIKAIISYADSSAGHKGSIYQSTNATYLGQQRPVPSWIVKNPKTDNYELRSQLSPQERQKLLAAGLTIEKLVPKTGKHKFVYALGKDQNERDQLLAKIVKPIFDYPKDNEKPRQIDNPAKERLKQKRIPHPPQHNQQQTKVGIIRKLLSSKVKNPETGNDILVKTALGYDKNHPSYKQARGMMQAWAKKHNINIKSTR